MLTSPIYTPKFGFEAHTRLSPKAASSVNLHWGADNPMTQFLSSNPMEEDTPELLTARLLSQRAHFCRSCPDEKHSVQQQLCELSEYALGDKRECPSPAGILTVGPHARPKLRVCRAPPSHSKTIYIQQKGLIVHRSAQH